MYSIGQLVSCFELTAELGRGGWGIVYAARHVHLGTAHALKIVHAHERTVRLRALREARIQARLLHPQVLRATDAFERDQQVIIVFDLVEGPTLAHRLGQGPLTLVEAEAIAAALAGGVAFLHHRRIVHRDIKPSNILLEPDLAPPVCRLGDFGIARDLGEPDAVEITEPDAVVGTPRYMAPERLRGRRGVDPGLDVYSLGCVLYEVFTGHRPFPDGDLAHQASLREDESYVAPRARRPEIDPWVDRALQACMRGDPRRRLPDAQVLVEVLAGRIDPGRWARGSKARMERGITLPPLGDAPLTTQPLSPGGPATPSSQR
jgi:serine/threonine-protein kinase